MNIKIVVYVYLRELFISAHQWESGHKDTINLIVSTINVKYAGLWYLNYVYEIFRFMKTILYAC